VDDVLLFSRTFEEHLRHMGIVLDKLLRAGFTLNATKCKFCQSEIRFLGHKIDRRGVSADPDRVSAILAYPTPKNVKQLRQFLGTCNFHSRFIVGYGNYTAPLLPLLQQGTKWRWTKVMQGAFEKLRASFANSIHLIHPRIGLPYSIYTDASKLGISSVLMQESDSGEKLVVSTASRVLSSTERKYSTCEQELLAVVYALQKFRLYIFGYKVTVYSDNKALSFLKKCSLTSNRVTRWIMQIQEYDLEIVHIKGTDNFFADALSRNPVGLTEEGLDQIRKPKEIFVSTINLNLDPHLKKELKDLAKYQLEDPRIKKIRQSLEASTFARTDKFMLKDQVLYHKNDRSHPYWRPVLPKNLEYRVISYAHMLLGHQGTDKCMYHLSHSFYIKNLGRKVRKYVSHCDLCQRVKHPNRAYEIEARSHLPVKPGELVSLDLYGPLPTGRGGVKYILVCLDVFSKHVTLYPLKSATTKGCLNKLKSHYFLKVTTPRAVLCDHGSQFTSPLWRKALSALNVEVKYTPIRHPESNPAERVMRELNKYFKIYCNVTQKQWPELIPYISEWLNGSASGTTGYSPIELMFDEPRPDLFRKILNKTSEQLPTAETLESKVIKAYARMRMRAEERKIKRRAGGTRWKPQLQDKVLVKCQPTSDAAQGVTGKFRRPYEGPFRISKIIIPSIYEVSDDHGKLRGQFNLGHLKPYLESLN
jgi:hypothetical protein